MPEHDHHRAGIDIPCPQQDDGKVALQPLFARYVKPKTVWQQIWPLKLQSLRMRPIKRDKIPVLVGRKLDLVLQLSSKCQPRRNLTVNIPPTANLPNLAIVKRNGNGKRSVKRSVSLSDRNPPINRLPQLNTG